MATRELRQAAIRCLEPNSFTAQHARIDINTFKHAIYALAQSHGIFELYITDQDAASMGIERQLAREAPDEPEEQAAAYIINAFEMQTKLYEKQVTKIAELKFKVVQTMEYSVLQNIGQPVFGTLRMSVLDILNALEGAYSTLTINELQAIYAEWTARRWEPASDLIVFMSTFRETADFLSQHHYAPPQGQQVMTLMNAIAHVPSFAGMANQSFHTNYPATDQQTLAHLTEIYTEVYRTQYENTTAAQHHNAMYQVITKDEDIHAATIQSIMATVRGSLPPNTKLTHQQLLDLQAEIVKTITRVLNSGSEQAPNRSMGRSPAMKKADTRRKDVATACTNRKSKSTCIYVTQPHPLVDLRDSKSYISVVMDIETTGFSHSADNIIQLAARANWVKPNGLWGSENFNEYVSLPPGYTKARRKGVPHHIAKLTGITSRTLRTKGIPFECMWRKFTNWLSECSSKSISNSGKGTPVVLIAHNGKAFDFPFLHAALIKSQLHQNWERKANIVCFIDTLLILRSDEAWNSCKSKDISGIRSEKNNKENRSTLCNKEVRQNSDIVPAEKATVESLESYSCKPPKQSLGALHEHLFGTPIAGAHNALADVAALCSVLTSPAVRGRWQYVGNEMQLTRLSSSDNIS